MAISIKNKNTRSTDEDDAPLKVNVVDDVADETPVNKPAKATAAPAAPVVTPQTQYVVFNCFVHMDPAPTIGKFNFTAELNVTKLEVGKQYRVPYNVGMHLLDKKCGIIVG